MAHRAPGKHYRKGLSMVQAMSLFPDDETAQKWIESEVWPDGPFCPKCGSVNIQTPIKHSSMTHRCRDCPNRYQFSLKTGTAMQGTKLGYRVWAVAIYLLATNLKSVSSMKLHRDLGITQKSAWHLSHRIRESWHRDGAPFVGPSEADETYFGGKRGNMPKAKRKKLKGRGAADKTAVVGVKDRTTNKIRAHVVQSVDAETLQEFVCENTDHGSVVYTDSATAYVGMADREHEAVNHNAGEYVRGMAHTQGIESFWSMLKRAHKGTFHKLSPKHLDRYVAEFAGHHNDREEDTLEVMGNIASGLSGKRLRYSDLTAPNGMDSGARS